MHAQQSQTISYVITAIVIGLVMLLRFRNVGRARRLNLNTLWIVPAIFCAVLAATLYQAPPRDPMIWLWMVVAAALGAVLGWRRGKLMRIHVDPATGTLNQTASPAALLFIVFVLLARWAMRYEAAAYGINIMKVTDIMLASAIGLFAAMRIEMYTRAKRILGGATI